MKSLNLLIDKNENLKICDFGLSKSTSGESINTLFGTLNWCAPEILSILLIFNFFFNYFCFYFYFYFLVGKAFSKKADVYSMGLVLWEILAHEKPYSNLKVLQISEHVLSGKIPPFPTDKNCAEGYKNVIEKCLKLDPKDRPTFEWIERALKNINPNDF